MKQLTSSTSKQLGDTDKLARFMRCDTLQVINYKICFVLLAKRTSLFMLGNDRQTSKSPNWPTYPYGIMGAS